MPTWETVLGFGVMVVWAICLIWGLAEMAIAEWKGNCDYSSPLLIALTMSLCLASGTSAICSSRSRNTTTKPLRTQTGPLF